MNQPPKPASPYRDPYPLRRRTALVTGASRRLGIGHAIARRLAAHGASVYLHHHTPHDEEQPWGADSGGIEAVLESVREVGTEDAVFADGPANLAQPDAPARLVADAAEALGGRLDILVANHALSGDDGPLDAIDAGMLDAHWAVNTRSTVLLTQAFVRQRRSTGAELRRRAEDEPPTGRIVFLTSGQDRRGGMPDEVAYALAKGALASATRTLATALAEERVTLNTVNPGPVDTGYVTGEEHLAVARLFPGGRWGTPDEAARLISWLCTDEAEWITGEVINSEGGYAR